jgi:lipooligosaccharide transport system ATP-binding protein
VDRSTLPVDGDHPAVVARGLTKTFTSADGSTVQAVDGIDLDVPRGISFGVLGPNGAGKTTTMKMLSCVSPPTAGSLVVLGMDPLVQPRQVKALIGVVPQGMTLDDDLFVRENLIAHGRYHGLGRIEARARAAVLLGFANLEHRADAKIEELSGGMQRRLLIARALVNDPRLVILDEPTTGLDPQARQVVWERLRQLRSQGKTLIITTHYMDEAARLCDQLVVVDRGRIIASGSPLELIAQHVPPRVVELHGSNATDAEIHAAIGPAAREVETVGGRAMAYGHDSAAIVRSVRASGLEHQALLERDATLEDVFLRLTGHSLTE